MQPAGVPREPYPQEGRTSADLLPPRRFPPRELLELVRQVGDGSRYWGMLGCGRRFFPARCGCGPRVSPISCGDRLCPQCERRRAAQACQKYAAIFEEKHWVRFITLTVKRFALGELRESLVKMRLWFRNLRRRLDRSHPGLLEGGVYSIETKGKRAHRDDRGGWHTHVHVLAFGSRHGWMRKSELALVWAEVTGGRVDWNRYHALPLSIRKSVAEVCAVPSPAKPHGCLLEEGRGSVVDVQQPEKDPDGSFTGALKEALKYVTKGATEKDQESAVAGWTPAMAEEFYKATKHVRLFQKFGAAGKVAPLESCECEHCGEVPEVINQQCSMSEKTARAYLAGHAPPGWYHHPDNWPSREEPDAPD